MNIEQMIGQLRATNSPDEAMAWRTLAKTKFASPEYNRVLALLPETLRRRVVKAMRRTQGEFGGHAMTWPRPKTFERYRMVTAGAST